MDCGQNLQRHEEIMSNQLERLANSAVKGLVQGVKQEATSQIAPHVAKVRNGLPAFLGGEPDDDDDNDDDGEGDDGVSVDPCELVYLFGLDRAGADDPDFAANNLSRAVAIFRVVTVADGKKPSHHVATHPDGYAAVGPADLLVNDVISKSQLAGISDDWDVYETWHSVMGLEYDLSDVADFADEICDDEGADLDEQRAAHDDFNWEHVANSVTVVDIPGVKACWQLGHALQVQTDRGKLDWERLSPLPFAYAIDTDTLLVHGSHVCVTPRGVEVNSRTPMGYADWRQQFDGREEFEIDGIESPCFALGKAKVFDYRSNKDDKNPKHFKDYTHQHGEESGELPTIFAVGPRTFAICGGNMWIAPEGIRD